MGNECWVRVSKGRFEKTGVCRTQQECKRAGLIRQVYSEGRKQRNGEGRLEPSRFADQRWWGRQVASQRF
jgi:hypothetical protein